MHQLCRNTEGSGIFYLLFPAVEKAETAKPSSLRQGCQAPTSCWSHRKMGRWYANSRLREDLGERLTKAVAVEGC